MASDFFRQVYRVVSTIPAGQVATYGQIAAYVGNPRAARTVGWALHGLPAGSGVPWHRVINAQGAISTSREGSRAAQQRAMLEEEGILFDERGRTDLARYGWKGLR
ncbi:MAG: MGMT family protein [Dehalococcoidia bacterium]|nr:MAG: MGMT family protein [Dehalococcoidia bacterium]